MSSLELDRCQHTQTRDVVCHHREAIARFAQRLTSCIRYASIVLGHDVGLEGYPRQRRSATSSWLA